MANKKTLIAIVGPTAVGKTAMAISLAQYFKTEIISADSRQFYREMSIGTAKPDAKELAAAPHHFINSHSISQDYSAGDFEREALLRLNELFRQHDVVIMVGGSGLFVRALCEGLDDLPKAGEEVRERLNNEMAQLGIEKMKERLNAIDPVYYQVADVDNPQRVVRALEVFEATGKPMSFYHKKDVDKRPFDILTIGLNMERSQLYARINLRVDRMMETGLLEEVKSLIPFRSKPALLTVGYAELFDYLDGNISLGDAVDKIKQNSRRYAKRQITWFKKYGDTVWFQPTETGDIIDFIQAKLHGSNKEN
ncbi:tRNA (adenosine(37)-N6)-dimethylallyltransferase MiaA [Sphingobacterium sp. DR205]|uniref:tRNA (adenosine(37)-N6)-dimethylallyltransferase MiaA n=1 Tax=Sphingobacterium sp. DR205 TaxID=2713573 RepID=UPI0013E46972|nr:tRNA (adenosine(37)-N6)-dimethylallyltransferase MiaA [Sphingobacterium sp. DR205]QIH36306.1 tRNA (adenosine(37)-N6)-dimethylallyltransferase MiaA [Sphingobacterium sp. DR205]